MTDKKFSINDRGKSFVFAFQGLKVFFTSQHNAWIHSFIALAVIGAGFYFKLNANEWCWLTIAISTVFVSELFNTAIEFLSDVVSPQLHPQIKKVKDIAAAAVLITTIASIAIGLIIFYPKVF